MSNKTDLTINAMSPPRRGHEIFHNIWQKLRSTYLFVDAFRIMDEFDWIFVSGDDTFLIVDWLKHFLSRVEFLYGVKTPMFSGQVLLT